MTYQPGIDVLVRAISERLYCINTPNGWIQPLVPKREDVSGLALLFDAARQHIRVQHPMSAEQFANCYTGPRKRRYLAAARSLAESGISHQDARLKYFLKFETYNFDEKPNPSPRGINPRSDRYLVELGRFLHSIEKRIYKAIALVFGHPVIMKGYNQAQRGAILDKLMSEVDDPVAIPADASRFEQSIDIPHLEVEHKWYLEFFRGEDRKHLAFLLDLQKHNKGSAHASDGDLKFSIDGKRMSGDKNTSSGNCIISASLWYEFAKEKGWLTLTRFFCDGDDAVMIIPRKYLKEFQQDYLVFCSKRGFRMKLDKVACILEQIDFCQSRPVWTPQGYVMVRNPVSVSKDCHSKAPINNEKIARRWIKAVGLCGLSCNGGIPVMQEFYRAMIRYAGDVKALDLTHPLMVRQFRYKVYGMDREEDVIHPRTRASYAVAFNVSPSEQLLLEKHMAESHLEFTFETRPSITRIGLM
ncbi:hypothetical protein 2 [Wenzhou tombus-like virus 7]|uniref:hypothetical protein 2 n=1 Tax=Wenzhou tombus-like virus 7 TaxID=1923677 RepID=UPI00090A698E|nr:hypothetical protein 2 [Wenzhou tombus-like virus 7]APG76635.1 hypothetical protein 2 [Wenzhou tombus-like virus 7]